MYGNCGQQSFAIPGTAMSAVDPLIGSTALLKDLKNYIAFSALIFIKRH
jgi:hypothetical protein